MDEEHSSDDHWTQRNDVRAALLLVAVLGLGFLLFSGGDRDAPSTTSGTIDSGTETACRRFVDLASDYSVLTRSERIDAAQTMEQRARVSDEPAIRAAARNLTEGMIDGTATDDDVHRMGEACEQAGAIDG